MNRENWKKNFQELIQNKVYIIMLSLTAICSYGFMVTHHTIGIDDTPYAYYFEEGLAAIVGRWVLFLINKVLHLSDFAPFMTDFVGVLLFMVGVTVWCMLFRSIFKDKVPMVGYVFFSCLFLSCPLISEVYTYYLHNGVALGYLCSGISLVCFREGILRQNKEESKKNRILPFFFSILFLWISIGCYESFMIVWLLGVFLIFLTERLMGYRRNVFQILLCMAIVAAAGMVFRSIMISLVIKFFQLEALREEAVQRSITEMAGWLFEEGAFSEFAMVLKRIFIMYGVFAYAYYPIKVFLMASVMIAGLCIYRTIRQKDIWILLLMAGSFVVSFLLVVIEGKATLYRSAQFLPVICAYGAILFVYACRTCLDKLFQNRKKEKQAKISSKNQRKEAQQNSINGKMDWKSIITKVQVCIGALAVGFLGSILWNQCTDINKWFYIDYLKYQDAVETVNNIAYELEKNFDTSKPVVFTGTYEVPRSIIGEAYVEYNTPVYYKMQHVASLVDKQLLEKFNRPYGVWVAQTPSLSVIDWGRYAFDNDEELVRFFAMHGHELVPLLDESLYEGAEQYSLDLPHFPQEGSIVDMGEYIIVHF